MLETLRKEFVIDLTKVREEITRDEGFRRFPYRCTGGRMTVGIGRNLQDTGLTRGEAEYLLNNDIARAIADLRRLFREFDFFPEQVQRVLINMRFQLGPGTFRRFRKFRAACKKRKWKKAAREMIDSKWYRQTPSRAKRLVKIMKNS